MVAMMSNRSLEIQEGRTTIRGRILYAIAINWAKVALRISTRL
jgi:hypothetical protein